MFAELNMVGKKEKEEEKKDDVTSFEKEQHEHFVKERKLFLWGAVDDESMQKLIKNFLYLNSLNHDDITLFINSPGGVITSGLALYDVIQSIESDVVTIVCAQAASMGAVLCCAGTAGKRYAWPHARIMIHQPLINGHFQGPASDIEIQAEEMLRVRESLNTILAKHSGKSMKEIEKDTDRDNFMSANQAIEYGLIDLLETKY
jgi:ATP-dependent Clp protease, protease subunit